MSIYQPIDTIVQVKEKGQPRKYLFPTPIACTTCYQLMGIEMGEVGNGGSAWQMDRHPLKPLKPRVRVHDSPLAFACYLLGVGYRHGHGPGEWSLHCRPCTCRKENANWKDLDLSHVINSYGMLSMGASPCGRCHLATKAQWSDCSAEEQWIISMLHHGSAMHHFDNAPPSTGICQCHGELAQLREMIESDLPGILKDSGWAASNTTLARRGIVDYQRTVTFECDISGNELKLYEKFLTMDKCPGWTGIHTHCQGAGVYIFSTTMDSSD